MPKIEEFPDSVQRAELFDQSDGGLKSRLVHLLCGDWTAWSGPIEPQHLTLKEQFMELNFLSKADALTDCLIPFVKTMIHTREPLTEGRIR